jgi:two-component system, LytTR family, response regulator
MQNQQLKLSVTEGAFTINASDIIRLKASNSYTVIYFVNRRPLIISKVLKSFEEELGNCGFIRTHRTHLINSRYIHCVTDNKKILMTDNFIAEISRRMKPSVMKQLIHAA